MTFDMMIKIFSIGVSCGIVLKLIVGLLFFAVDSLIGILRNIIS